MTTDAIIQKTRLLARGLTDSVRASLYASGGVLDREIVFTLDSHQLWIGNFLISGGSGGSTLDIDGTMAANSDAVAASQKATRTYITAYVATALSGLTKSSVGLSNADNTADASKPVSTAQATALALKANLASPALTGTPTAPTATPGNNTTVLATTAFVRAEVAALVASAPSNLDTLKELADALGDDVNFATTVNAAIAGKQDSSARLDQLALLAFDSDNQYIRYNPDNGLLEVSPNNGLTGADGPAGADGLGYELQSNPGTPFALGSVTIDLQSGNTTAYAIGSRIRLANTLDPESSWLEGVITAYAHPGSQITLTVDLLGPGTSNGGLFNLSIAGQPAAGGGGIGGSTGDTDGAILVADGTSGDKVKASTTWKLDGSGNLMPTSNNVQRIGDNGGNSPAFIGSAGTMYSPLFLTDAVGTIRFYGQCDLTSPESGVFKITNGGGALMEFANLSSLGSVTGGARIGAISGEMNVLDDSGNVTVISPHAKDAPAELYEEGPGIDRMDRTLNIFKGEVVWWAETRRQNIDALDMAARLGSAEDSAAAWAEVLDRRATNRVRCKVTETFADYEARTGLSLWPGETPEARAAFAALSKGDRWNFSEAEHAARAQAAIDAWNIATQTALTGWTSRRDAAQTANQPFTEPAPVASTPPSTYVARPIPAFLT
jgi:hypothetical protein